jgi:hypothetical protein
MPVSDRTDSADFAGKFRLALEALNWSRTRCARELGLDKSVINRRASGSAIPTEHNRTRFTEKLRLVHPRFQASAWRLPPTALTAWFQPEPVATLHEAAGGSRKRGHLSIAVLAFTSMSATPDDEYFADGMAEDIQCARQRRVLMFGPNGLTGYWPIFSPRRDELTTAVASAIEPAVEVAIAIECYTSLPTAWMHGKPISAGCL